MDPFGGGQNGETQGKQMVLALFRLKKGSILIPFLDPPFGPQTWPQGSLTIPYGGRGGAWGDAFIQESPNGNTKQQPPLNRNKTTPPPEHSLSLSLEPR